MSVPVNSPSAAVLAETLLGEWEQRACPAGTPTYEAARQPVRALFTELCETLLAAGLTNIDHEDVRTVLGQAYSLGIGAASAQGPGRAARIAALVLAATQAHQLGPRAAGLGHTALLSISSRIDTPLEMDELTIITEAIQRTLSDDAEIIFGHDEHANSSAAELQVWLLVGFRDGA